MSSQALQVLCRLSELASSSPSATKQCDPQILSSLFSLLLPRLKIRNLPDPLRIFILKSYAALLPSLPSPDWKNVLSLSKFLGPFGLNLGMKNPDVRSALVGVFTNVATFQEYKTLGHVVDVSET